ncbi:hypothetical protein [Microbulbifer sp. GL-2]|uniref:hypothetical protein n=1 Tax=Microbulbifer sp. GL-2 TaxID=2591606 RepID=UPI001163C8A6|nr:hypothetical protein [Microbulbifer sp. GL-2]BBM01910.1 hypothetical protein GL2_19840 [Microbulbifer sp. GL-2]
MKVHLLASMTTILLISGCSSTPEVPTSESFVTDITELGHKRFTYKASQEIKPSGRGGRGNKPSHGPGMGGGGKPPGGKPGGGKTTSGDIKKTAMERIELLLNESGFCSNGWFLIEQTFDQNRAEILGECRAAAPQ